VSALTSQEPKAASPYERELIALIEEYRTRLEQALRTKGVTREAHTLQVGLAWLEERLASYRRGLAWFRVKRVHKAEH
jgi:hypothetical protein